MEVLPAKTSGFGPIEAACAVAAFGPASFLFVFFFKHDLEYSTINIYFMIIL